MCHISAPSGCLQYHLTPNGVIRSFNYSPSPNGQLNSIGVEGTRQLASLSYGICIQAISSCSITYTVLSSDVNSFTMTGDVGAVDPILLGTVTLQDQNCKFLPTKMHQISSSHKKINIKIIHIDIDCRQHRLCHHTRSNAKW